MQPSAPPAYDKAHQHQQPVHVVAQVVYDPNQPNPHMHHVQHVQPMMQMQPMQVQGSVVMQPMQMQGSVMRQPLPGSTEQVSTMNPYHYQQQQAQQAQPQQQPQQDGQPQLLVLGTPQKTEEPQCLVGINPRMHKANVGAAWLGGVVFIMTIVIVFVPAWGQYFGKNLVSGSSGPGMTACYMETTMNVGLFNWEQRVYYYCDMSGTGNLYDETRENLLGQTMNCDFLRESNDDGADVDAACDDLSSAAGAGVTTLVAVIIQFVLLLARFWSWRNVSVLSLIVVPICCFVQIICAFTSVGAYPGVNDVITVATFHFQGAEIVQDDITMKDGGCWATMIVVGILSIFQLWIACATLALWRQDPQPPNKQGVPCMCGMLACCCGACFCLEGPCECSCRNCCRCRNCFRCPNNCGTGNLDGCCALFCCILTAIIPR